jgi:hypothetical protein
MLIRLDMVLSPPICSTYTELETMRDHATVYHIKLDQNRILDKYSLYTNYLVLKIMLS